LTARAHRRLSDDLFEAVRLVGYAVVPSVFDRDFLEETRAALQRAYANVVADIGKERLERAGELGVIRNMFAYDDHWYRLIENPTILEIVDRTVGETAILHLQNGFILPSLAKAATPQIFQNAFHRDFPRYLNGYVASINIMVAVDAFDDTTGATLVIPGSHQSPDPPTTDDISSRAASITAPAGSLVIFDSTLWHAAGHNVSGRDRMAVNHQFTRSWIKQQIDYVRAIGPQKLEHQQPRTQQLLGMFSRVVTSLDEFYQPEDQRLYRRGQG
jgi:ectoine hydroxylase-related dioxygenase (phytanoyl-CoA dioxygenase family)